MASPATPGMVGAELANLANEAALLAARRDHRQVQRRDLTDSLEKIPLGAPRGIALWDGDRERTAYHEAGHALVGMLPPGADPVRKGSIIPRGGALGLTLSAPDDDHASYTREDLFAKLRVAVAGCVAEELACGTITTGAEADIQQLTTIARQMVGRLGMSDAIGLVDVLPADGEGQLLPVASATSEATQQLLDHEVHRLIDAAHTEVTVCSPTSRSARQPHRHAAGGGNARSKETHTRRPACHCTTRPRSRCSICTRPATEEAHNDKAQTPALGCADRRRACAHRLR